VHFKSPVNGDAVFLGPEEAIQVQHDLGADIVMIFDECTPFPASEEQTQASMELSLRWAERSKIAHGDNESLRWAERSKIAHGDNESALFGIVQGGMYPELRRALRLNCLQTNHVISWAWAHRKILSRQSAVG